MPILKSYKKLERIALTEFPDIVVTTKIHILSSGDPQKLRLEIVDNSLIDIFLSEYGRYSYHWERRLTEVGGVYRHDNAPHARWEHLATYPKHFHDGSERNVVSSYLHDHPEKAIREFLIFVRLKLLGETPTS